MRDSRMEDLDGRALGTAAHAMLERWDFGADPPIDAVLREFCPRLALREAYRNALSEMAAGFRESPLWPRLSASAALAREVPFSWVADGMTLRGKIDLLLDHDLIVDYKTGARDDARHARHVLQLQLYAAAAAAAGRPVREAYVYYLQSGIAEAVDVSAESLAALNERLQHALAPAQAGHS
jgi:ATP-dependent exoDNAse (exonuclease V) beta subunit